jgi:hypothetical protein
VNRQASRGTARVWVATLAAVVTAAVFPLAASAAAPVSVNGGGQGTYGGDFDGNGTVDGSHFGFGVVFGPGGSAQGHFLCQMAGNVPFLGLKLMSVEGRVTEGSADVGSGTATFGGVARVNLANGQIFTDVPFRVAITAGGPGAGQLVLPVIGAFYGVPGDTLTGNGNYDLPTETVVSGAITIQ